MKVLFLGHYRDDDPESDISQNLILSMHHAGINLICRHIYTNQKTKSNIHPIISQLENNSKDGCTICIQYLHPEYLVGTRKFEKNIAILNTDNINDPSTSELLSVYSLFDNVWVFDENQKSKVKKYINNISIVPPPSLDLKQKINFLYNSPQNSMDYFSIENAAKIIKELLSA